MKANLSMSPLITKYYKNWISSPTLLGHPNDQEQFYKFIKACLRYSKKGKDGQWLKYFLEKDLKNKLHKDDLTKQCSQAISIFDHIIDFFDVRFPDNLIEMKNPSNVAFDLRRIENEDGTRYYSEKEINKILIDNFGEEKKCHLFNKKE